jgi:hypothetical protein
MQFLVLAHDGKDDQGKARRASARPRHSEGIRPMVERGELRAAGAILDDSGHMIGSVLLTDFPTRAEGPAFVFEGWTSTSIAGMTEGIVLGAN